MTQRDIKFRGISIETGEWLYGSLLNNAFLVAKTKEPCLYIYDNKNGADSMEDVASILEDSQVKNESVGQYTGLKDRNGMEIYESDRVAYLNFTLIVKWKLGGFVLEIEGNEKGEYFHFYDMSHGMLEVIGNVHENGMVQPAKTPEA